MEEEDVSSLRHQRLHVCFKINIDPTYKWEMMKKKKFVLLANHIYMTKQNEP